MDNTVDTKLLTPGSTRWGVDNLVVTHGVCRVVCPCICNKGRVILRLRRGLRQTAFIMYKPLVTKVTAKFIISNRIYMMSLVMKMSVLYASF